MRHLRRYAHFWLLLALSRSDLPRDVGAPGLRWPLSFSWLLLAFRKKLDLVALGPLQEVIKPRDAVAPGLRWLVFILWFLLACKKLSFVIHISVFNDHRFSLRIVHFRAVSHLEASQSFQ